MTTLDYDPNILRKFHKKTIKLVFGMWKYRLETTVDVNGNIAGLDLIEFATEKFYAGLPTDDFGAPKLILSNEAGDTLLITQDDDDTDDEDWLKKMLVSAEIIAIETEKAGAE